jgi:O-antigen/teichoic acid export membrane protein
MSPAEDFTGRRQLVGNVLFSWGGQMVFIVAGFIMPRMIDHHLGQTVLGIWDFAWSLVAYFQFIEAGVTSSVNCYVGRYWSIQDFQSINRIVTSATLMLALAGMLILLLSGGLSALLPYLFSDQLGGHASGARAAVLCLGAALCVQTVLGAFNGVVAGCHRWDLLNINRGGWQLATTAAMIVALVLGGRLLSLAVITLVGETCGQLGRVAIAYRVCKGLRLTPSLVDRATIGELYLYGAKILVPSISNMLLNSVTSTLVVAYLGPATLALFTRPRSLIRQIDSLVRRMTMTLIPTTSSLEGAGDMEAIRSLLIKSVRYTLYIALPAVIVLTIFGGAVMQVWMGPRYAAGLLVAVLTLGSAGMLVQTPILCVLAGLNSHGRPGIAQCVASGLAALLVYVALGPLHLGILGAAFGVSVPLALTGVIYNSIVVCGRLEMHMGEYVWAVTCKPIVHLLPFIVVLLTFRFCFWGSPLLGLSLGLVVGGVVLGIVYWRHVIPMSLKQATLTRLPGFIRVTACTRERSSQPEPERA